MLFYIIKYAKIYFYAIVFNDNGIIWFASATLVLLVAIFHPRILAPFNKVWTKFGFLLHSITSPIILGIMYFCVFTPLGLTMRLFGWDALNRKLKLKEETYWIEREPDQPSPESMKEQF